MNIEAEKTCASIEQIGAQAATLMDGESQFSRKEDEKAKRILMGLIAEERLHGNKRLLKIYSDALAELRRRG